MSDNPSKIIHIDMDAYYASVEQRDNPELRGKPIAVGGSEIRGVVTTCSYEARKFGVRSAMPGLTAKKKCPDLIFIKPRFDVYRDVSKKIMSIFNEFTDLVEPLSLDEAFLDVTINKKGIKSATIVAKEIKKRIKAELNLTASAGVSINKFLAKVASDMDKPNGLYVIPPDKADAFIEKLDINKVPGIGKVTSQKMKKMGLNTCGDLKKMNRAELHKKFGKVGSYYYKIVHGEYNSTVKPNRIRKSISSERTFDNDLINVDDMLERLEVITKHVVKYLEKRKIKGRTVTIKIKYFDFVSKTRSKSLPNWICSFDEIYPIVKELLYKPSIPEKPIRLLGVGLSNLNTTERNEDKDQFTLLL
jgi:DNA polymerase-4